MPRDSTTAKLFYRMPAHFGPTPGPRQGPNGEKFTDADSPLSVVASVSFLTDQAKLEDILPPGFSLDGEPVVTIEMRHMTEIEWLAGRGYNTFGVTFPARYDGTRDHVAAPFLAVLWENLPDPILSGRDELGFSKIYAELPPPRVLRGRRIFEAAWLGHGFATMELSDLKSVQPSALPAPRSGGRLHYKYIPRTGAPGEADVAYATFTPPTGYNVKMLSAAQGRGAVQFHRSTWEELPTMAHIVNTLAELPQIEMRGAMLLETRGAKDLSDQKALA
jgi:hypothetical protein